MCGEPCPRTRQRHDAPRWPARGGKNIGTTTPNEHGRVGRQSRRRQVAAARAGAAREVAAPAVEQTAAAAAVVVGTAGAGRAVVGLAA